MRVLHAGLGKKLSEGMLRQMLLEQKAANELGIEWTSKVITPDDLSILESFSIKEKQIADSVITSDTSISPGWLSVKRFFYSWLIKNQDNYDVIVLRYSMTDPYLPFFIKQCKKPVFLVHHTFEVLEIKTLGGLKGRLRAVVESIIGQFSLRFATNLVGVTNEILQYEYNRISKKSRHGYVYPNGYAIVDNQIVVDNRGETPTLLFVASQFHPWHGLDILLSSLNKVKTSFFLHLVGEITEIQKQQIKDDNRIIAHGRLRFDEIKEIASYCHVALSSFALQRQGMSEACPLKVREYLAMGLPVYAGHQDCFPHTFPFFTNGPAEIRAIIDFANEVSIVSRSDIAALAEPYINKKYLLNNFYNWIKENIS